MTAADVRAVGRFARLLTVSWFAGVGVGVIVWLASYAQGDPNARPWGYTAHIVTMALMAIAQRMAEIYAPVEFRHIHRVIAKPEPPRLLPDLSKETPAPISEGDQIYQQQTAYIDRFHCDLKPHRLKHAIVRTLIGDKVSARGLMGMTEGEIRKYRKWLRQQGIAEEYQGGVRLTEGAADWLRDNALPYLS